MSTWFINFLCAKLYVKINPTYVPKVRRRIASAALWNLPYHKILFDSLIDTDVNYLFYYNVLVISFFSCLSKQFMQPSIYGTINLCNQHLCKKLFCPKLVFSTIFVSVKCSLQQLSRLFVYLWLILGMPLVLTLLMLSGCDTSMVFLRQALHVK